MINNYYKKMQKNLKKKIQHIKNRPHHPQINGALERYHRELHKYLCDYLKDIKVFNYEDLENDIFEYIKYYNNKKNPPLNLLQIKLEILIMKSSFNLIIEKMIKSLKKI